MERQTQGVPDSMLLDGARRGCAESFATLYRNHSGRVYRFALEMCGNASAAEEVTQEVFLALLGEMERFDPSRGNLLAYLLGTARNLTYRWLRREQPFQPLEVDDSALAPECATEASALSRLTEREALDGLRRAIASLPPAYREVVVLCDLEELDYAQAAQTIGCAIGTVRSRLHRARALLTEKWHQEQRKGSMRCSA
ncbi:MAG: RNA polymerase sigma factor [Bryobacterales bacterium]|nr:RNA polymerase sigma factor [Bryobacterales bacterium]